MPRTNRGPYLKFIVARDKWYIHWAEKGRVRQRSTGTRDRNAANLQLADFIQQVHRASRDRGPVDPRDFSIAEALAIYGDEQAPSASDPARIGYAIKALLPFWEDRLVSDITRETCRGYTRERTTVGRKPGTIRRELTTLRAAVNYVKSEGRITWAPTVHLPVKPEGRDRWLTPGEAAALLSAARTGHPTTRLYLPLFILIALYTGARSEAILSLRWPQINLEARRVNFNPPGRVRTSKGRAHIPIPQRLLTFLRLARKRGSDLGYVVHRDGEKISRVKRAFRTTVERAGLEDVTPHTLRHTCGTWLAQRAVPLDQIGAWLGHSDTRTTQLYAHHHPDYMLRALDAADRRAR